MCKECRNEVFAAKALLCPSLIDIRQHEGLESSHFVGYGDAFSTIVLVFVLILAFTAINIQLLWC
jgi:hypothetical protein